MKKMTFVGASALLAAVAMLGGCASDNQAVASDGSAQKTSCSDKASGCCANKSAEAKVGGTCTAGEAKAGGCCTGAKATTEAKNN